MAGKFPLFQETFCLSDFNEAEQVNQAETLDLNRHICEP